MNNQEERHSLYLQLEELHRKQRGWQRLVEDERLDYSILDKMSIEKLKEVINQIKEEA